MSWLSDRTGVHWNLRPYAAAAGGVLGGMVGGPLGAGLGAALFKTTDNKAHGDSWTHALEQGALNGALAYGTGAIGQHVGGGAGAPGGQLPGVQFTPSSEAGMATPGGAVLNLATPSPVQQSVMSRVMGGAGTAARGLGTFVKDNHATLETLGSGAQGILNATAQNRQANIEQQGVDAQTAQIQAAIAKQQQVQAAFAQMYGQHIGGQAMGAPSGASRSIAAPGAPSRIVVDGEADPGTRGEGNDGNGGQTPQTGSVTGGSNGGAPTPAQLSIMQRLGYLQPPGQNDYTSLMQMYGMPGGY